MELIQIWNWLIEGGYEINRTMLMFIRIYLCRLSTTKDIIKWNMNYAITE